jgi:Zn-dependent protease
LFPLSTAGQIPSLLMWAPILFVGILFHEFGHALVIKRLGYGDSVIVLQGLGGVTINERRGRAAPKKSLLINVAGPAASLLLSVLFAAAFLLLYGDFSAGSLLGTSLLGVFSMPAFESYLGEFLYKMAAINGLWALFNMLPISPMDGGHVVENVLHLAYGNRRKALLHAAYASLVALGLLVLGVMLLLQGAGLILVLLVFMFGFHNYRTIQRLRGGHSVRRYR